MSYKHLLVHLDGSERSLERLDLAVKLARRWGARLTGLFAEGTTWAPRLGARRRRARPAAALDGIAGAFQARTRAAKVEAERWDVPNGEMDVGGVAARFCRYADLAILGQPDRDEVRVPLDLAEQVLLESGRPVLLVPSAGHYPDVGRRVMVEWNGTREAARALNDAVPFMSDAEQVLVLALQSRTERRAAEDVPAQDVVRHLAAHGVRARSETMWVTRRDGRQDGLEVLDLLLSRSADFAADLVVMGGRGRHGVPFPRTGRSTRKSLESMTAPVLLSH